MSSNFHFALSNKAFKLDVASLEISMPETSFTLSWISLRIFVRWCPVVSEFEQVGNEGGVFARPGDITAMSENRKNSERREMYNLTTSRAIVVHCLGLLREDPVIVF